RLLRLKIYLWFCIPWVAMGAGQTFGGVPSVWYYFRPEDGNLWVTFFFVSGLVVSIVISYWIYLANGAIILAEHGFIRIRLPFPITNVTPKKVKFIVGFFLAAGTLGFVTMLVMNVPIPSIP